MSELVVLMVILLAIGSGVVVETAAETLATGAFHLLPRIIIGARVIFSSLIGGVSVPPTYRWALQEQAVGSVWEVCATIFFSALLVETLLIILIRAVAASAKK